MARYSTTPPYARERKALAWLERPKTSLEVAELLCLTPNHASALCRRLWLRGRVTRTPEKRQYGGIVYRYEAVKE
jgi:predicted transcriptional regulator